MFEVEQKQQDLADNRAIQRPKSFILRKIRFGYSHADKIENLSLHNQKTYIHQSLASEIAFGHTFLCIPVFLIFGAYFNFSRKLDIFDGFLLIPIILLIAVLVLLQRINTGSRTLIRFCIAFFIGAYCANIEMNKSTILIDTDVTTHINGTILSKSIGTNGSPRYKILIHSTSQPQITRPPEKVQLVARGQGGTLDVGDMIDARVRLTRPSGPVYPRGYDFAFGAYINDIGAYGFVLGSPVITGHAEPSLLPLESRLELLIGQIQAGISSRINSQLTGDAAAIASALIIADKKAISEETVDALRNAGLAHILAISGLHMVLASGTLFVTIRAFLSLFPSLVQSIPVKKIAAFAALLAASSYLVISGAPISAQRAWLMLVIMLGAVIFDKPVITLRNVAIAAIIIVVISPSAVTTPGFQMSFAAATALVSIYGAWARLKAKNYASSSSYFRETYFYKVLQFVIGLGLTALIAGLATGIFSSFHFHQLASYGVLGNILAMPVVTLLVMPVALLSMLVMPYGLEWMVLPSLGQSIEMVIYVAEWVAALGGEIKTGKPHPAVTAILVAGFLIFVLMRTSIRLVGFGIMGIGLSLSTILSVPVPDILISEDGKLIGVRHGQVLQVNRSRPSAFISEQWQSAFLFELEKPQKITASQIEFDQANPKRDEIRGMLDGDGRFKCFNTHFCIKMKNELLIATLGKTEHLYQACKFSDIIIATFGINRTLRTECSSKTIISRYELKESGSMAFYFDGSHSENFRVETAISDAVRPWTIQRYFNWRANEYWLPDGQTLKRTAN